MRPALDNRARTALTAIALLFIGGILLSFRIGAAAGYDEQIIMLFRLPRTICAVAVGGSLAVAGVLIQASLGNALAEPYTIGIASAASLGAVIGSLLPGHARLGSGVFAFLFSIAGLLLLASWLRRSFRYSTEVLLAGVVLGLFFTSLATLVMAVTDPAAWSNSIVWMMGALTHLNLAEAVAALLLLLFTCGWGWMHWKPLDLLAVDEVSAETAGVDVGQLRRRIFLLVAIITALCVSSSGVIGFVGLIVPHVLRRMGFHSHFLLVPLSFFSGGALVLYSDVLARIAVPPTELPVGVILAVVGAPAFLVLARAQRGNA